MCSEICGDGLLLSIQLQCDDGNTVDGDGCSSSCKIEQDYECTGKAPSRCKYVRAPIPEIKEVAKEELESVEQKAIVKFDMSLNMPDEVMIRDALVVYVES